MKKKILLCWICLILVMASSVVAQEVTPTPQLTPTPTPTPTGMDRYEPNDTSDRAILIGVGMDINATLHIGDVDWWAFMLKAGRTYRISVNTRPGGDPRAALYSSAFALVAANDDCAPGDLSPCMYYTPPVEDYYFLEITSQVTGLFAEYTLRITEVLPTPTPTPIQVTPQPTPTPNDPYEPNYNFDLAAEIGIGQVVRANLPPGDNDFFKLPVKAGLAYQCETSNLQGSLDTNVIIYDQNRQGIGGNDDRALGNPASLVQWWSHYQGWVYVLVGPVSGSGTYTLICTALAPTPTPQPTVPVVAAPNLPNPNSAPAPTPTRIYIPTPTPLPGVGVSGALGATNGTAWQNAASTPTALPPIRVVLYYDDNNNNAPETTEGIQAAVVILQDAATNRPLTWALTDQAGYAQLDVPAGSGYLLRVSIPYLGFSRSVSPGQQIPVQIKSQRAPALIP